MRAEKLAIFIIAALLSFAVRAHAQESATAAQRLPGAPMQTFALAGEAYEAGDYTDAAQLYESIVDSGIKSGTVYYNLGNAYFRAGDLGRAILNYRRAQRLMPRDVELRENLDYARTLAIDEAKKTVVPTFHGRWLEHAKRYSPNEIMLAVSALYIAAMVMFCAAIFADGAGVKKFFRRGGALLLLLSVSVGATLGYIVYERRSSPPAIITAERVEVRAGPGAEFSTVFVLHTGAEAIVRRARDGWIKIEFPSVGRGWLRDSDIEKI